MKTLPSALTSYFSARVAVELRSLIWITCADRSTGAAQTFGFWEGADDATFTIDGVDRIYRGAGSVLGVDPIVLNSGLPVQMQLIHLAPAHPAVAQALRQYDARLAPVEIHQAGFQPGTNVLVDTRRVFVGMIDGITITRDAEGGSYIAEVTLASSARALTRILAATKSDADLRRRNASDGFRKYSSVAGAIPYWWGEAGPQTTAAAPSQQSPGGTGNANNGWGGSPYWNR